MKKSILASIEEAVRAARYLQNPSSVQFIEQVADKIAKCFQNNKKILIIGNGGSLCDAMHFAEELTGQFRQPRKALPAIALADPGHMSCVSNDMGFEYVFVRGVEALGNPGDLLIVLTTSGNSANLCLAVDVAHKKELETIAFLGKTGGKLKGLCHLEWIVSGFSFSDRIQEAHMAAIHIIIEMVEKLLFVDHAKLSALIRSAVH